MGGAPVGRYNFSGILPELTHCFETCFLIVFWLHDRVVSTASIG